VPEVTARDQGGLLDVALDPEFADNRLVYLSHARPAGGGDTSTAVSRGRLSEDRTRLLDVETIFVQEPAVPVAKHFGSRLVFDGAGHLFVTTGEHFTRKWRDLAQELDNHFGKVVRILPTGAVPGDNPFADRQDAKPEIFSYGHRNIQAAAIHPETGALWEIEHGPKGGDEINIVEAGANYGWPLVSHGINYDGTPVGTGRERMEGTRQPILVWTPVIAPSGMAFYDGEAFPEWRGDLLVGGLVARGIVRVETTADDAREAERIGTALDRRIRDVVVGPEGAVYALTDHADGEVLRFSPAE
jgi:glucose/arabinose dehydrogenase